MNNKFRLTLEQVTKQQVSQNNFVLGEVIKKQMRTIQAEEGANTKKKQTVLFMLIRDETNCMLTKFYSNCNEYNKLIAIGQIIKISHPTIKSLNVGTDIIYNIEIDRNEKSKTIVSVCSNTDFVFEKIIPPCTNNYLVKDITKPDVFISLTCVIKNVFPTKSIQTKNGETVKRTIVVTDSTMTDLFISFWGEDDCKLCNGFIPKQSIVHFWNLKTNEYNGKFDCKYAFETIITMNPKTKERYEFEMKLPLFVKKWNEENMHKSFVNPDEIIDYYKLMDLKKLLTSSKEIYGKCNVVISNIEADINSAISFFCANCHSYCGSVQYCEKCSTTQVTPSLRINVDVIDESGSIHKVPIRNYVALKFLGIEQDEVASKYTPVTDQNKMEEEKKFPIEHVQIVMSSPAFINSLENIHLYQHHTISFKVSNQKLSLLDIELSKNLHQANQFKTVGMIEV